MNKALVARFYGWSPATVDKLTYKEFALYLNSMVMIQAQEDLRTTDVISYPNFKPQTKKKFKQALEKMSTQFKEKKLADFKDIAKQFASRMMNNGR